MGKLWVGTEVEGKYVGMKTLFVAGKVPFNKITQAIEKHNPSQVYFGAGNLQLYSYDAVIKIVDAYPSLLVSIDTFFPRTIPDRLRDKVHIIAQFQLYMHYLKPTDQLKVVGKDKVYLYPVEGALTNTLDEYKNDEVIYNDEEYEKPVDNI